LRFALLLGATSPLLACIALGVPALYVVEDPSLLLWLLRGVPAGLLTGYLVHRIAVAERVRSRQALGGA
jgi:hypothetical protein